MVSRRKTYLLLIVSALLRFLSHPPFQIPGLIFFALFGFCFFHEHESGWSLFLGSWLWGGLFFLPSLFWLRHVTFGGWLILSLYLALYPALFTIIWKYSFPSTPTLWVFCGASLWTVFEWLRSFVFSGFPYLFLSHGLSPLPVFVQFSELTGSWGVSFLIFFVNGTIYLLVKNWMFSSEQSTDSNQDSSQLWIPVSVAATFVISAVVFGLVTSESRAPKKTPKIGIVQGNIPLSLKHDPASAKHIFKKHLRHSRKLSPEAELIIWPETMYPFPIRISEGGELSPPAGFERYIQSVPTDHLLGITTLKTSGGKPTKRYNSLWYIQPSPPSPPTEESSDRTPLSESKLQSMFQTRHDKYRLVPFGEYLPFVNDYSWIKRLYNQFLPVDRFFSITPGPPPENASLIHWKTYRIVPSICYEIMFPDETRKYVKKGGDFIVNVSNEAWYNEEAELDQMWNAVRLRAIENRTAIVRATNTGISGVISPTGTAKKMRDSDGNDRKFSGTMIVKPSIFTKETLYTQWGNWFPFSLLIGLLTFLLIFHVHSYASAKHFY